MVPRDGLDPRLLDVPGRLGLELALPAARRGALQRADGQLRDRPGPAVASVFIYTGSLRVSDIVAAQDQPLFGIEGIPGWNVVPLFPAFLVFVVGMVAEAGRPPVRPRRGRGRARRRVQHRVLRHEVRRCSCSPSSWRAITMSAVVVTLFFGGPNGPTFGLGEPFTSLLPIVWFTLKVSVFVLFFITAARRAAARALQAADGPRVEGPDPGRAGVDHGHGRRSCCSRSSGRSARQRAPRARRRRVGHRRCSRSSAAAATTPRRRRDPRAGAIDGAPTGVADARARRRVTTAPDREEVTR